MPPSIFSEVGGLISADIKDGEANVLIKAADTLAPEEGPLEALVDTEAPQGVAALVAAIEKADSILGPANAAAVNATINVYSTQIKTELTSLIDAAGGKLEALVPAGVTAMKNVAIKLQTEANEQRHPGETAAQAAPPADE